MIEMRVKDDLMCPVVICDECGNEIQETGVVGFQKFGDPLPIFLHKGKCDDNSEYPFWEELDVWLLQVASNAGLNLARFFADDDDS